MVMVDFMGDLKRARKKCSVTGCETQYGRFFSFPNPRKKPAMLQTWLKAVSNLSLLSGPPDIAVKNKYICAEHFEPQYLVFGIRSRGLTWNAVPTLKLKPGKPANLEDTSNRDSTPHNIGSALSETPEDLENHMDNESSMDDQSKNNVVYELKTLANEFNDEEHPVESLEVPNDDTSFSINITSDLCRLCLENSPQMWNFFSIITLDDQSTIDVVVAFEKLTGEHVEEHENSRLPKHICQACLDLLVCAHLFQQKYEKSSTILKSLLTENCESVEIVKTEESCTEDSETGHETVLIPESKNDFSIPVGDIQELSDDGVGSSPQPEIELQSDRKRKREDDNETFKHRYKDSLSRHINQTHLSLYQCEYCTKSFGSKWSLNAHERTHTGQKEHICNICGKTFTLKSSLNRHMTGHILELPDTSNND